MGAFGWLFILGGLILIIGRLVGVCISDNVDWTRAIIDWVAALGVILIPTVATIVLGFIARLRIAILSYARGNNSEQIEDNQVQNSSDNDQNQ